MQKITGRYIKSANPPPSRQTKPGSLAAATSLSRGLLGRSRGRKSEFETLFHNKITDIIS